MKKLRRYRLTLVIEDSQSMRKHEIVRAVTEAIDAVQVALRVDLVEGMERVKLCARCGENLGPDSMPGRKTCYACTHLKVEEQEEARTLRKQK
jgi:hypothetical protein